MQKINKKHQFFTKINTKQLKLSVIAQIKMLKCVFNKLLGFLETMNTFTNQVIDAFSFLKEKYRFSKPEVENLGREVFVRFHRDDETVSISMEAGSQPLIEMFLLCRGTEEKPVPWAERNGKQRYRKFPKLSESGDFFQSGAKEFEDIESDWLKT